MYSPSLSLKATPILSASGYVVSIFLSSKFKNHFHGGSFFGVGRFYRGEITIRFCLRVYNMTVGKTEMPEYFRNQPVTGTMKRSIRNRNIGLLFVPKREFLQVLNVTLNNVIADGNY